MMTALLVLLLAACMGLWASVQHLVREVGNDWRAFTKWVDSL